MRLTNYIRDSFVRAVMQDVPFIDYTEQIRSAVMKAAVARLPKTAQALYNDPKTRDFIVKSRCFHAGVNIDTVPGFSQWNTPAGATKEEAKAFFDQFADLVNKKAAQEKQRDELERKLKATAAACSTRKSLLEMLPEFEKYLPAEAEPSKNLPAISNLVVDLVKAGWPKDGRKSLKVSPA